MPLAFLDQPGPLAFAHRGGAAHAPENSWRAFEHAVGLGYRYLETDLQATADGVLFAFHDRTLARVTGQPGRVCRLNHSDIAGALIRGTEPIPRFEDLLGAWPDVRFNIDVKDAPAIRPLAEVLRRTGAWDRVCICSFSASRLRVTRRALDRPVCMAASPLAAAAVWIGGPRGSSRGPGSRGGRGSRGPGDSRGPQRPGAARNWRWPSGRAGSAAGRGQRALPAWPSAGLAERLARAGVRCLQVPFSLVSEPYLARAHALGLQVHAWTVNNREAMASMLDLGVDGIMSDETVALRDVLASRGQWHPGAAARA
jgi:glycerophosphoryl diester phosphodiesterase